MITAAHPAWIVVVSIALALLPVVIGLCTSYIKVSVVLGFIRSGLGAQQVPGQIVIMALSMAITMYVMAPVFDKSLANAGSISYGEILKTPTIEHLSALAPVLLPWREFMLKHSGKREYAVMESLTLVQLSDKDTNHIVKPEPSFRIIASSFVLTELKESFAMGFAVLLPFLVIDLIVANVLAGLGMMMVSPVMISLPLKLILFVVSDGWLLLTKGLITSYGN